MLKTFAVLFWPLMWLKDRAFSIRDIKKEQGQWIVAPWSLYGTPVSIIVMGIVAVLWVNFEEPLTVLSNILITIVFYVVGMYCERQNYVAVGSVEKLRKMADPDNTILGEFVPFVLIQSVIVMILVLLWI